MRDFTKTRFKKRVAITEVDLFFINNIRKKKSAAGKLEEIIKFYKENNLQKHENISKIKCESLRNIQRGRFVSKVRW